MVRVPRDPKGIVVVVVVLCASTGTMLKAVATNRAVRNFITKLLGSRALQRKTIYKRILQKLFVGILNQDDNLRSYLDDRGTTGKLFDAGQFGAVPPEALWRKAFGGRRRSLTRAIVGRRRRFEKCGFAEVSRDG
jgi:hypothetical protein